MLGGFISGARESAKIGALTSQVIKSTGGAAQLTADQIGDLATATSNKTGVDDEAIQSGENLLLTFTNLKNGVGKGNDIFTQTTSIMTDMSVALGQDMKGSAIQLGKALNDPVKGVSALSKVGVSFTQQQKDQIATLVKAGDTMGAQRVILKELGKEFGGAAAAASTPMDKLKVTLGNLGETIGGILIPFVDRAATLLNTFASGALAAFSSGGLGGVVTYVQNLIAGALPGIKAKLGEWASAFGAWVVAATPPLLVALGGLLKQLGAWIVGVGLPLLGSYLLKWGTAFVQWVAPYIPPLLAALGDLLKQVGAWVLNVGLPTLGAYLLKWGTAFVQWIGPMIPPALAALGELLRQVGVWIVTVGLPALGVALGRLGLAFVEWIGPMIPPALAALGRFALALTGWLLGTALPWAVVALAKLALAFVEWIGPMIPRALGALGLLGIALSEWVLTKALPSLSEKMGKLGLAALKALGQGLVDGSAAVFSWLGELPGKVLDAVAGFDTLLLEAGRKLMAGLAQGIADGVKGVLHSVTGLAGKIKGFFPGSPVKEGPLTSWNNGGAGKRLGGMLADGLAASQGDVANASARLAGSVRAGSVSGALSPGAAASGAGGSLTIQHYGRDFTPDVVVTGLNQYHALNGGALFAGAGLAGVG